jgi:succinoglycan biosynthesis protein ExoO
VQRRKRSPLFFAQERRHWCSRSINGKEGAQARALCEDGTSHLAEQKAVKMQEAVMPITTNAPIEVIDGTDDMISVIMSNYRGARWLEPAIKTVMAQTHRQLELIVVDDASGDDSVAIVRAAMSHDTRIRLIECPGNLGPAGARNLALDAARGDWVAVVDSDDLIHPARLSRLLAAARHLGCDAVADDMIFFGDTPDAGGRTLLQSMALTAPRGIGLTEFLASDNGGAGLPPFGYLKPLIRRSCLQGLRYDPTLRVGEDFDFYARLVLGGLRLCVVPDAMYLYRRHTASVSHRLSADVLTPLLAAHHALSAMLPADDTALSAAMRHRQDALTWALHYAQLVAALKQRDIATTARLLSRHPRLVKPMWQSLRERRRRGKGVHSQHASVPLELVLVPAGATLPPELTARISPTARWITIPSIPAPGLSADTPIAPLAAQLSDLSSRHQLDVLAIGSDGEFASGMVPAAARVRIWPDPAT